MANNDEIDLTGFDPKYDSEDSDSNEDSDSTEELDSLMDKLDALLIAKKEELRPDALVKLLALRPVAEEQVEASSKRMEASSKRVEASRKQLAADINQMEASKKQLEADLKQMEASSKQLVADRKQLEALLETVATLIGEMAGLLNDKND